MKQEVKQRKSNQKDTVDCLYRVLRKKTLSIPYFDGIEIVKEQWEGYTVFFFPVRSTINYSQQKPRMLKLAYLAVKKSIF